MSRRLFQLLFFFPLVLGGVILFQFWPQFKEMSLREVTRYFERPGVKASGIRGDPLRGFQIDHVQVDLPIAQFTLEGVDIAFGSWLTNLKNQSLIFDRITIRKLSTQFHSVLSLPERHFRSVGANYFKTFGAHRIRIYELQVDMPLVRKPVIFPEVVIENWVTRPEAFTLSEFKVDSPHFRFQVSDQGTRIMGEFKSLGFSNLKRSIPFRAKIHPLPGRRALIWSLFEGAWSGEYDPLQKFHWKVTNWNTASWFKVAPPIDQVHLDLKINAQDFGGRLQMGSILMALLTDAVDIPIEFRMGQVTYQNEPIQILGSGPKAKMLQKLAQASQGFFKPSSFVFRSKVGRHHELLRLLPRVFDRKSDAIFELISPTKEELEQELAEILFALPVSKLNQAQEEILEQSLPFFSKKKVVLGFQLPPEWKGELERSPAARDPELDSTAQEEQTDESIGEPNQSE
jgi:hypothetical protein